jgi:hypothetical protein
VGGGRNVLELLLGEDLGARVVFRGRLAGAGNV